MLDLDPSDLTGFVHSPHGWLMTLAQNLDKTPALISYLRGRRNEQPMQGTQYVWMGSLEPEKDLARVVRKGGPSLGWPGALGGSPEELFGSVPGLLAGPLGAPSLVSGTAPLWTAGATRYPIPAAPTIKSWPCTSEKHDWRTKEDADRCCKPE